MEKNVLVTVEGVQQDDAGEMGRTGTAVPGEYYFRNGSHYIFYTEEAEDSGEGIRTVLKLKEKQLELTRRGTADNRMVFEQGRRHATDYATPLGSLRLETATSRILCLEEEKRLQIKAEYELWAEEMKVSSNRLTITIEPL